MRYKYCLIKKSTRTRFRFITKKGISDQNYYLKMFGARAYVTLAAYFRRFKNTCIAAGEYVDREKSDIPKFGFLVKKMFKRLPRPGVIRNVFVYVEAERNLCFQLQEIQYLNDDMSLNLLRNVMPSLSSQASASNINFQRIVSL